MKRAGSRWSDLGARAILDLRCHTLLTKSRPSVTGGRRGDPPPLPDPRPKWRRLRRYVPMGLARKWVTSIA